MLFGGPDADVTWARDTYTGWILGHGIRGIVTHENQKEHKEAEISCFQWLHNQRIHPTERLLDVFTTGDTSGEALCKKIVAILKCCGIDLKCMIGQSYDGAGNMRGQFSGLKTRILEHAERAVYVWC